MSASVSTEPTASDIVDEGMSSEEAFFGNLADEAIAADGAADITVHIAFIVWWDDLPIAQRGVLSADHAWTGFKAGFLAGALKLALSEGAAA